jgi:signal transduction histidine kinase
VLLEAGLPAALAELAERYRLSGLTVELATDDVPGLDQATASALYGVAVEAIRNVTRHASATRCRVSLTARPEGGLALAVTDDGIGIPTGVASGVGMQSMRERADAIGATLSITPNEPAGTRVELRTAVRVPA